MDYRLIDILLLENIYYDNYYGFFFIYWILWTIGVYFYFFEARYFRFIIKIFLFNV